MSLLCRFFVLGVSFDSQTESVSPRPQSEHVLQLRICLPGGLGIPSEKRRPFTKEAHTNKLFNAVALGCGNMNPEFPHL